MATKVQPWSFITWLKFSYPNSIDFQLGINFFSAWISSTNCHRKKKKKFSRQWSIKDHRIHESRMRGNLKTKFGLLESLGGRILKNKFENLGILENRFFFFFFLKWHFLKKNWIQNLQNWKPWKQKIKKLTLEFSKFWKILEMDT